VTDPGNNVIDLLELFKVTYGTDSPLFWQFAQLIAYNTNLYTQQGRFTPEKATVVNAWISNEAL